MFPGFCNPAQEQGDNDYRNLSIHKLSPNVKSSTLQFALSSTAELASAIKTLSGSLVESILPLSTLFSNSRMFLCRESERFFLPWDLRGVQTVRSLSPCQKCVLSTTNMLII